MKDSKGMRVAAADGGKSSTARGRVSAHHVASSGHVSRGRSNLSREAGATSASPTRKRTVAASMDEVQGRQLPDLPAPQNAEAQDAVKPHVQHSPAETKSKSNWTARVVAKAKRALQTVTQPLQHHQPCDANGSAAISHAAHQKTGKAKQVAITIQSYCCMEPSHATMENIYHNRRRQSHVPHGVASRAYHAWLVHMQNNPAVDWIRYKNRNIKTGFWNQAEELLMFGESHQVEQFKLVLHSREMARRHSSGDYMESCSAAIAACWWIRVVRTHLNAYLPPHRTVYVICGIGKGINFAAVQLKLFDLWRKGVVADFEPQDDEGGFRVKL